MSGCTVTSVLVNDSIPEPATREHLGTMPWATFHQAMRIVRARPAGDNLWDAPHPDDDGVCIRYHAVDA